VEVAVDSRNPEKGHDRTGKLAIAAMIAVTACWSASALGLQSLEAPVETLSIERVDHVTIQNESTASDTVDIQTISGDSATPLLYLTPRVSNALRDIFATGPELDIASYRSKFPSSPIAETEDPADMSELTEDSLPTIEAEENIDLPLLQRQMYRTDI
jgi:hypothetical protein